MDRQILWEELKTLFLSHVEGPEIFEFLSAYQDYIHSVDDMIDEGFTPELLGKINNYAVICFSTTFWRKHCSELFLVEQLINNQYYDSVMWEHSNEEWKRKDAKCLSHSGYNMFFGIIYLFFGREKLREYSIKFREQTHLKHLNDNV